MSNRLDQQREAELQPVRHKYTCDRLTKLGLEIVSSSDTEIQILYNGNIIKHFPYSGWHQGKGIKAGRGIEKLIKQLTK